MRFGVLGPLEVRSDGGPLTIKGVKERRLLGLLLSRANSVVPVDDIIEALWGAGPPPSAAKSVQVYVVRVRKILEPRGRAANSSVLSRRGLGYVLCADGGQVDALRFADLVARAREAAAAGAYDMAARVLREALGLWRGAAYADFQDTLFGVTEAARLEEMRLGAVEARLDADLALGRHAEVTSELEALVHEYPLRERFWSQLMLALYRGGRQSDALAAYRRVWEMLADELGLEPGEELRSLEQAVLRQQVPTVPPLAAHRGGAAGAFQAAATRALPRDNTSFTGRQAELAHLMGALARRAANGAVVGIHAIGGMAGVGKTAFAVHAAHRLAGSFPDGQFFLPLYAHTPGQRPVEPADALASLLLTAGVPAPQIPPGVEARAARWRDCVAGRKILLVLDDAAGHEQVRPLLPGTAGSLVLITSRRRLTALEDAAVISLDTLPPGEAAELLARLAGRAGIGATDPAVDELTRLCGYLPLAIGMLASQLRHHPAWTVAGMAAELAAARDRLTVMHAENLSVAAAFDLSYADLTEDLQRLFRRLGLIPGPDFDAYAAAALDGTRLDEARRCLEELYDQHLLTEPAPGRYRLHDLLREHAQTLAADDDPTDRDAATGRLLDYYLHTVLAASRRITIQMTPTPPLPAGGQPGYVPQLSTPGQAASWLETERANLHAAVGYAAACGRSQHAIAIPAVMADFLDARGHWDQAAALHQTALTAARQAGDRAGQAGALTNLCSIQGGTGDYRAAAASATQAVALYRDLGDRAGQANALNNLGIVQRRTGDHQAATSCHQQALELFRDLGHRYGQGDALQELGACQLQTGDHAAAAESLQQALALYRDIGHRPGHASVLNHLGTVQRLTGDYPAAAVSYQQSLELSRDLGERVGQAYARNELGLLQQLTRDYPAAAASHHEALDVFRDLGDRLGEAETLNSLGELRSRSSASQQAHEYHTQALAIARDLCVPLVEARALEGLALAFGQDGNLTEAAAHLRSALRIYQRLRSPGTQRVQESLRNMRSNPASGPATDKKIRR
jgi:DNA-binding SARP family transcriptional activator/Tfp pilus assembly protein PilF